MNCSIVLTLIFGVASLASAREAWDPVAPSGQSLSQGQPGWSQIYQAQVYLTGIFACPTSKFVVAWGTDGYLVSRDAGQAWTGPMTPSRDSGISQAAIANGRILILTTDGRLFVDGRPLSDRSLGYFERLAVGSSGQVFVVTTDKVHLLDQAIQRPVQSCDGQLVMTMEGRGIVMVGNKAWSLAAEGVSPISFNGPRPTGYVPQVGPAVSIAYDSVGNRYEFNRGEVFCQSQIGRRVVAQATTPTKNGYFHFMTHDNSGIEIAGYSPRTGDAAPTSANQNQSPITLSSSLGNIVGYGKSYRLVAIGNDRIFQFNSK